MSDASGGKGDGGRLKRATSALTSFVNIYWIAICINAVLLMMFLFWALTASTYKYTYLLPAGRPGSLTSQRWSGDFVCTGSLVALFALILSAAWVAAHPTHGWGLTVHLILLLLEFLYYLSVISFVWSFLLARSNVPAADNADNPSNDARYCCVNYNLGGCDNSPNSAASPALAGYGCTPGLGQADLIVNGVFLFKFCGTIIALVFMLIDGIYVGFILRGAANECNAAIKALLPKQQQQQEEEEQSPEPDIKPPDGGYVITTTQQQRQPALPSAPPFESQPASSASAIRSGMRSPAKPMLSLPIRYPATTASNARQQQTPQALVPKLSMRIV